MSRAPRVLLSGVALAQPMGGVLRHNRELLPRLVELLRADGGQLAIMEGREPVPFEVPGAKRLPSDVPPHPPFSRAAAEGRALRKILGEAASAGAPFDVVHTAHLPAPRGLQVPFTLTLHDLKSISPATATLPRRWIGKRVVADAVRRAALTLTVSESLGRELHQHFQLPPERVRVVFNGGGHLPVAPRCPDRTHPHSGIMLFVGHVEPRKNIEVLVRALAVDTQLPELYIAGAERGEEGERLKRLAAELDVRSRVRFLGHLDDEALTSQYAAARCVVLPSQREGFGIPLIEAQRAGAPLAVADLPALREVAGPGVPHFDPRNAGDCAAALREALNTPEPELRAAAQRSLRFDWDRSAEAWCDALRTAAAQGS